VSRPKEPPSHDWLEMDSIRKDWNWRPEPRLPDPSRAAQNECPVCYRRFSLWGIGPCWKCPGRRVR
jgi:hypothetical protein